MGNVIISPGKYVQGSGELANIKTHIEKLGTSFLFIADDFVQSVTRETIEQSFAASPDLSVRFELFGKECCYSEINRIRKVVVEHGVNVVIGVGGGKTLDTAKAVAYFEKLPVVIVPTIASTDAPCSALSVVYTEKGEFEEYLLLPQNPNIVLVDTQVVANAPARLLAAGIGDALATYVEARAVKEANGKPMAGGNITLAAMALAKLCYDTLFEDGYKAMLAVEKNVVTKAVENIVEANTYLSGIGFESGGLAAAHAIHNGLTAIHDCHHLYHGEKVAFGTLAQLVLENRSFEEIERTAELCLSVGLPICLAQLGIVDNVEEKLMKVAVAACAEGETIHNMVVPATPEAVYAALIAADEIGKSILGVE